MINYTEQLMYGLMPVQREDPQAGQSEYYYFDPRYGDDDARHVVDVPDGTSPNPNADAIQQYLYENDEYRYKNLYGDTPPPTQTAVNDYTVNTENPMGKPSSYFQDNNSAGWSGNTVGFGVNPSYDTTPVLQNQTPTPWNNPEAQISPVPWRNNQTLAPWAGGYDLSIPAQSNGNYISDDDLYAKMWENIKEQEDVILHPYLDTKGLITIGGGANVNDWNVFKNLNVTVDGVPATEAQKWEAYQRLRQMSDEKDANGNYINRNLRADVFEDKTNIRISDAEARGLAKNHMNNDLAHLRKEFSDFDNFPLPLKKVLLDIQYNVRGGVNPNDWPNLYRAIRNRDVNGIVENVNRKDVQQSRNDWAKRTARLIRF